MTDKGNSLYPDIPKLLLSIVVTTLLVVSPAWMMISCYDLEVSVSNLFIFAIVFSFGYSYAYSLANKVVSTVMLIATPILVTLLICCDFFYTAYGLSTLLYYIGEFSLSEMPLDVEYSKIGFFSLCIVMNLMSLIPISFTSYAIMKRKKVIWALIPNLPYFLCAVALVYRVPDQLPCEVFLTAVILLLIVHISRSRNTTLSDRTILKLSLPLLIFILSLGAIYPQKGYKKDELAKQNIESLRSIALDLSNGSNEWLNKVLQLAESGRRKDEVVSTVASTIDSLAGEDTDLSTVGHFDPLAYRVCSVSLAINRDYDGPEELSTLGCLYLKEDSKDTYEDNVWTATDIDMPVFKEDAFVLQDQAQYRMRIDYYSDNPLVLTPYYTDFCMVDDNPSSVEDRGIYTDDIDPINPYNSYDEINPYEFRCVPTRVGDVYSDEYLNDYVYGTNLQVPDETREALIESGVLPDWYMMILNGELELSEADKIRAVTEFVRSIHPYDADTDYPPEGADFVTWFLTESDTGFCVHYATAEVILLRMIGVPARYVDGYIVSGISFNQEIPVDSKTSHAWFEVFIPEFGWIMGDSTPGNAGAARRYDINALTDLYPEFESAIDVSDPSQISVVDTTVPSDTSADESDPSVTESETSEETTVTTARPAATSGDNGSGDTGSDGSASAGEGESGTATDTDTKFSDLPWHSVITAVGTAFGVAVLLALGRLIYVGYWKRKFSRATNNEKAIAHYRYYVFKNKIIGCGQPKVATAIAEKAAFSNEQITDKELQTLIRAMRRSSDTLSKKMPWYAKFIYFFL